MGFLMSKLYELVAEGFSASNPARILLLGLDAAGKTTILYKFKLNETVTTIPTIGFNVETVSPGKGVTFTVWDVGGQEKIRRLWAHYYQNTDGLIYVVDSSDIERMSEAKSELFGILTHPEMANRKIPVVVLANKQDLPNAMSAAALVDKLELRTLPDNPWYIQSTCAVNGQGLYEGLHNMADMVKEYKRSGGPGRFPRF